MSGLPNKNSLQPIRDGTGRSAVASGAFGVRVAVHWVRADAAATATQEALDPSGLSGDGLPRIKSNEENSYE
jgi:hypothetical protein